MRQLLAILGILAIGSAAQAQINPSGSHQKEQRKSFEGKQTDDVHASSALSVLAIAACTPRGAALYGTQINGFLGSGSCTSFDPTYGTFYADFYTFNAVAGHKVQVSSNSGLSYLATIQDYSSGAVLASSGECGYVQDACSFTYTVPTSGTYDLGVGSFATGSYSVTLSDVTSGGGGGGTPNLTPYRPNYTGFSWTDKIVISTSVPATDNLVADSASITATDSLFVSWAADNQGTATVPAAVGSLMYNSLYLDGALLHSWSGAPNGGDWLGGYWISVRGYGIGKLTAGSHTLEFRVDETNVVSETNEGDNRYLRTFTVGNGAGGSCVGSVGNLCLNASRFHVAVSYATSTGSGNGTAIPLTSDTGYFWFFSSGNVEMVVKVVDGRAVNGKFWVFAGGLTNVGVTITVTDTQTGAVKQYVNPQNTAFQPIQDTSAF